MEFYKETDFQKTELGGIPKDWSIAIVSDICKRPEYGYTQSATEKPIGPKFLRITDIQNGNVYWDMVTYCKCPDSLINKYLLEPGDILFARSGATTGKSYLIKDCPKTIFASYLIRVRTKEKVIPEFLYYFFNSHSYWKQINQNIGGSAQGGMNASLLSDLEVHYPSKKEQRQIATILSRVDDAIQKTDEIIKKTQLLKKGLMQELLMKGIGHKEFKYSEELGCEIPKDWAVVKIEDIIPDRKGAIKIGPFGSQLKKNEMVPEGIKVYGQENVLGNDFTIGDRYISERKYKTLQSVEICPGDVLISMMGSIGYSVVFPEETEKGIMDSHLIRIQVIKDKCLPLFLSRLINDAVVIKNQIKSMSQGAIMSGLNSQIIKKIILPLPETKEQEEISSILVKVDDKIENERQTKDQLERLKKGLIQILLTGKVRVKVN